MIAFSITETPNEFVGPERRVLVSQVALCFGHSDRAAVNSDVRRLCFRDKDSRKVHFLREVLMQVVAILFCLVTLILAVGSKTAAQSTNPCDNPNNLPSSFFDVPQGPQGNWRASVSPEPQQADDPLVPVEVVGAGAIQGPANRRGMRLGCGDLRNRSQNSVTAVQLRWILVRTQDRSVIAQKGYTPDTVLLEGHTPPIELSIPKESLRRTDFSIISFAAVTQGLAKGGGGMLSGDYFLFVGVYGVLFENGSVWNAGPVR